ncbi:hypothetical protein J3A83DRAFT_3328797 [Scleroderma citrinum]
MSPRRMDISSLLCQDDPQPPQLSPKPRSIDALLHHPYSNSPTQPMQHSPTSSRSPTLQRDSVASHHSSRPPYSRSSPIVAPYSTESHPLSSQHRALSSSTFALPHSYSPTDPMHPRYTNLPFSTQPFPSLANPGHSPTMTSPTTIHPAPKQRSPFIGLEALVHVASQERRRISAGSTASSASIERDRDPERPVFHHEIVVSPLTDRPTATRAPSYLPASNFPPSTHPADHIPHGYSARDPPLHPHPQRHSYPASHPNSQRSPLHLDDEHRPHKRFRASRSPSPSSSHPNPSTIEILAPSPLPHAVPQLTLRGRSDSAGGGYPPVPQRKPSYSESHHRSYIYPPPESPVASSLGPAHFPSTAQPTGPVTPPFPPYMPHSRHSPSSSSSHISPVYPSHHSYPPSYLQSPSRRPSSHSLPPQQQTPSLPTSTPVSIHSISHLQPRSPILHRDARSASFTSPSAPKMTGGISLLRDDLPPPQEVPRCQQPSHGRFLPEEEHPYVQVQAHVPVQAPIPRLARAVWENEGDNAAKESYPSVLLQTSVSNSREESRDVRLPAPGPTRQALQLSPPDERIMDRKTEATASLAHLVEELSEQQKQIQTKLSPRPVTPSRASDIEQPSVREPAVVDPTPMEQDASLIREHPSKELEDEYRDMEEPMDELPTQTTPPSPSVAPAVVARTPSLTPDPLPSLPGQATQSPPPTLMSLTPPPSQIQEEIIDTPQPLVIMVLAQDPSRPSSPSAPMEPICPSRGEQDTEESIVDSQTEEHGDLSTQLLPTPPAAMETEVDNQSKESAQQVMAVDPSALKPILPSESAPDAIPPRVLDVVVPDTSHFSEPEVQIKREPKLEDESESAQPIVGASHSLTPLPAVKVEMHPDTDVLVSNSPPLPSDCRSEEVVESNHDITTTRIVDMDVDEELLSLVEGAPRRRRSPPVGTGTGTDILTVKADEVPEQGLQVPAVVMDEQRDRESMPPPAPSTKKGDSTDKSKDKGTLVGAAASSKKKKQDAASKVHPRI